MMFMVSHYMEKSYKKQMMEATMFAKKKVSIKDWLLVGQAAWCCSQVLSLPPNFKYPSPPKWTLAVYVQYLTSGICIMLKNGEN